MAFLLVVVLIGAGSGYLLWRSAERVEPIDTSATAVRVSMTGFMPSTLEAQAGVPLRINLINLDNAHHSDGGGWHDFVLPELGLNVSVEPEGQTIFTLEAPQPGTYTWYCDVCCGGKASPAMRGTLTVLA